MRTPDYYVVTISEGPIAVGAVQTIVIDHTGKVYGGVGMSSGRSWAVSGSITAGWLMTDGYPAQETLDKFLSEHADNISGGVGIGGGITYTNKGTAYEVGAYTPQIGATTTDTVYIGNLSDWIDDFVKSFSKGKPDDDNLDIFPNNRFDTEININRFNVVINVDPIILNLSKNGTHTAQLDGSTHFDYDGNGFAESTAWISGDSGLLVMDRDLNGSIDTGKELFGDQTPLSNGKIAVNGFQALADLDKNGDGKIDASDAAWSSLRVWVDNGDGVSQAGELKTLDELGIKSLNLSRRDTNLVDAQGNKKILSGTFEWNDGTIGDMSDYLLKTDLVHTVAKNEVAVSEDVNQLPYLPGYGNIESSWQIMMKETDGTLRWLMESYANAAETDARDSILDEIIYEMTGSSQIDPTSRGSHVNAQKLAVLEKIYGNQFNNGRGPNQWAGPMLDSLYENVKKYYSGWLVLQVDEKALFDEMKYTFDVDKNELQLDLSKVKEGLESKLSLNFEEGKNSLRNFVNGAWSFGFADSVEFKSLCQDFISQDDALALVIYSAGRNERSGISGDNSLYSQAYDEILIGGAGHDYLEAHGGDTVLCGGADADMLVGCKGASEYRWGKGASDGNVIYLWNKGDGNDTIVNAVALNDSSNAGTSMIYLGVGITLESLTFFQNNKNLQIINKDTGEILKVESWFIDDDYKIDGIRFANGDTITREQMNKLITRGDPAENNYIEGSVVDDTYIWGKGYGNDTINNVIRDDWGNIIKGGTDVVEINAGLSIDDLEWKQVGENLVLVIKETSETLTFIDWYENPFNPVDSIRFSDGTILSTRQVDELTAVMKGTDGDDRMIGSNTRGDMFDSGAGNDYMEGKGGDDTYIWGKGDGNDTIYNVTKNSWGFSYDIGTDVVQMKEGLTARDLEWKQEVENLVVKIKETGETLTFTDWYESPYNPVDSIHFSDGTVLTTQQVDEFTAVMKGTDGDDRMIGSNTRGDIFDSGAGNDYMEGNDGDDTYIWGRGYGNDTINNVKLSSDGNFTIDGGADIVRLTEGVSVDDLKWECDGNDLIATIKDTGEKLTFTNWFENMMNAVDSVNFADGTILQASQINEMTVNVKGTNLDDVLFGGDERNNIIRGEGGNDTLYGKYGNDELYGGTGDDKLYGEDGDDILDGGAGDDYLEGGKGEDTYIWGYGSGNDTIYAYVPDTMYALDTIRFGEGITKDTLEYESSKNDLIFRNKDSGETLTIRDYFNFINYKIAYAEFADGSQMTAEEIEKFVEIPDTAGKILYGGDGDDILAGGSGTDYLGGRGGADIYIWGKGYGNDTINAYEPHVPSYDSYGLDIVRFGEGITKEDLEYQSYKNDLIFKIKDSGETLTIRDYFKSNDCQIVKAEFADGVEMTAAEIEKLVVIPYTAGNDTLYGTNGNDILNGGAGDDYLEGGGGEDIYIWGNGSGNDTIYACEPYPAHRAVDTIRFGEGITMGTLKYRQSGDNLIFTNQETGETLTVADYYYGNSWQIAKLEFANGTILTNEQINDLANPLAAFASRSAIAPRAAMAFAAPTSSYDPIMQQITDAAIAFDGDSGALGSSDMMAGNHSIMDTNSELVFACGDPSESHQMSRYIQTKK